MTFPSIHLVLYLFFIRKLYFPHFLKPTIIREKPNLVFKILIIDVLKNHTLKLLNRKNILFFKNLSILYKFLKN